MKPLETSARIPLLGAGAAFTIAAAYALITNHVWEDYLITSRHSRNLVEGYGLVYQAGERVHGFTSPINVLLPALFYWLFGQVSYFPALWAYRLVSALAFGGAVWWLLRWTLKYDRTPAAAILCGLYLVLDFKTVSFSMNGQETAFLLLFLVLAFTAAADGLDSNWRQAGVAWAGLMWTRPDGCVYIAALALLGCLFAKQKRGELTGTVKAASVCTVLYLPWFTWAWIYYGSPVPFPAMVKSSMFPGTLRLTGYVSGVFANFPTALLWTYAPPYWHLGGWPGWVELFSYVAGGFALLYAVLPGGDRVGRMASLAFSLSLLYMAYIGYTSYIFPWYLPPAAFFGIVVLSRAPALASRWAPAGAAKAALGFNIVLLAAMASLFVAGTIEMRIQQDVVEFGNRARIGDWLKERAAPGETVFLEPIGYVGYYSEAKILDFPGIVTPEVAAISRTLGMTGSIERLRPDWLVLRPSEEDALKQNRSVYEDYELIEVFDVTRELKDLNYLPGEGYVMNAAKFLIFRRKASPRSALLHGRGSFG